MMGNVPEVQMKDMRRIIDRCELRTETDIIVLQHFSGLGEPCTYDVEEHFAIDSATGDKTLLYKRRSKQGYIDTDHPLVELYGTGWGTMNLPTLTDGASIRP